MDWFLSHENDERHVYISSPQNSVEICVHICSTCSWYPTLLSSFLSGFHYSSWWKKSLITCTCIIFIINYHTSYPCIMYLIFHLFKKTQLELFIILGKLHVIFFFTYSIVVQYQTNTLGIAWFCWLHIHVYSFWLVP